MSTSVTYKPWGKNNVIFCYKLISEMTNLLTFRTRLAEQLKPICQKRTFFFRKKMDS